jgi:mono/diheme cytochrome c family protein
MGHPEYPLLPMAAYDTTALPDDTLNAMLDFLAAQPQPTTGETLYADYCRNCHGADAQGGVTGVGLVGEGLNAFINTVRSGDNPTAFATQPRSGYMPQWTADELSDAEITMIRDYVLTL